LRSASEATLDFGPTYVVGRYNDFVTATAGALISFGLVKLEEALEEAIASRYWWTTNTTCSNGAAVLKLLVLASSSAASPVT
jgi:hypothetical protein